MKGRDDSRLRNRLKALAERYPRYGYPTLHDTLNGEGQGVNRKRTYRLYREESLQGRTQRRKKLPRPRVPMLVPDSVNLCGSIDFMSDQLANGRRFRILNVVYDYSRECVLQIVDVSISGQRLARELDHLTWPLLNTIFSENGPELTCKALFFWAKRTGVKLHSIEPGKPTQNAFIKSFNGKFRAFCLDLHWFANIEDARSTIERWRSHYNDEKPRRSVGSKPPALFALEVA